MTYPDAVEVRVGDIVSFGVAGQGKVVACMYRGEYSASHCREEWSYLGTGVMIDTTFGGLIHYPDQASLDSEHASLVERGS